MSLVGALIALCIGLVLIYVGNRSADPIRLVLFIIGAILAIAGGIYTIVDLLALSGAGVS